MIEWIESSLGHPVAGAQHLLGVALAAAMGISVALVAHWLVFRVLHRVALASESESDDIVVRRLARPSRYALVALGISFAARASATLEAAWSRVSDFILPALLGWIALSLLRSLVDAMALHAAGAVADDRNTRRRRTRLAILSRIGTFLIVFVTVALMLLAIPAVRQVGVTLMASAGLAALAVGAAAQPALKALIGGIQLALTEPISIDDLVVIDGESGRIEDIRTTYVVVRLSDERRMIVPTTRFLDSTFQNWTRKGTQLTGSVMLYLDPGTDVAQVRAEFERQIKADPRWDQRSQRVQVTNMTHEAMEVRLLMTAKDSGALFDLRCAIREGMLDWLRRQEGKG